MLLNFDDIVDVLALGEAKPTPEHCQDCNAYETCERVYRFKRWANHPDQSQPGVPHQFEHAKRALEVCEGV